jgi:hypothetical protein
MKETQKTGQCQPSHSVLPRLEWIYRFPGVQ